MSRSPGKVAVIGAGVAGVVSAYLLQRKFDVTLYDQNNYVGGHTNTITIEEGPDAGTRVDTGFIVLNDRTYPNFTKFLNQLGVKTRDSDMSFGFYNEATGLQYAGNGFSGLFAQRQNLLKPGFWRLILDVYRFGREGINDLKTGAYENKLGAYVAAKGFSKAMIDEYLLPMGSAIWSTPPGEIWEFPTDTFLKFFNNHGLLDLSDRPQWQTVVGGSKSYIEAFLKKFQGTIKTGAAVKSIRRKGKKIMVEVKGRKISYDKAVIAAHADEALRFLADASKEEKSLLGAWRYQVNRTLLHTDVSVLPPHLRAWASWNYTKEKDSDEMGKTSLTYDMNRLQGLSTQRRYLVTLNREATIDQGQILREFRYTHPTYTLASVATQGRLSSLNGVRDIYFCGSYFGFGFHEDAVTAAAAVGESLGVSL